MALPDNDQVNSALRHVYTGVGVATATLVVVGLSQGDATTIGAAVHKIGDGAASIIMGISMLVPVVSGFYASWSASPMSKMLSFKKDPQIAQVVAIAGTPMGAIAASIPGDKITTTATVPVAPTT